MCALGITDSPGAGPAPGREPALRRNSSLRVYVSGCPNSCAQHQAGDIGLAGSKVRVGGRTTDGYQIFLGADLDGHRIGEVVGRVAEDDLDAAVDAVVGTWEALRHPGETLGRTVRRIGLDAFSHQIGACTGSAGRPAPSRRPSPSRSAAAGRLPRLQIAAVSSTLQACRRSPSGRARRPVTSSPARAARSGRSLQEYLRLELIKLAERPDPAELMARVRERKQLLRPRWTPTRFCSSATPAGR